MEICVWKLAHSIRYGPKRFRIARLSELPPRALDVLLGVLISGNALKDYVLEYMLTVETESLGLQGAYHLRRSVLLKVGSSCPNLRTLDLRRCQHVTNQIVRNVLELCTQLEMLRVDGCAKISDSAFISKTVLPGLLSLRELSLGECSQISSGGLTDHIITGAPQLKILGLAFCDCVVTNSVATKLLYDCNLESLDLSFCSQITDAPFHEGRNLESLRHVNLTQVSVTDVAIQLLASQAPLLEELDAGYSLKLTDASVLAVVDGCPQLRRICVRNTDITDAAFSTLARCRHLEYLDASWCTRVTSNAIGILAVPAAAEHSPIKRLILDSLGGCLAMPMSSPSALIDLVTTYGASLEELMLGNLRDVIDANSLHAIADNCSNLQQLAIAMPGNSKAEVLSEGLHDIGFKCRRLSLLRLDASACQHHALVESLAPPYFGELRSLSLTCCSVAGGLMDSELEKILVGRTMLQTLELRSCGGLSEGLFQSWCGQGNSNSSQDEISKRLSQSLLQDHALATESGSLVTPPAQQMPFDAKSISTESTEAPSTLCDDLHHGELQSRQPASHARCPAAIALSSVSNLLIDGAQDLSDRSADALAMLLHDVQEVDLRGSAQLTSAVITEHRSFRKWCRFLRSVNVVAGRTAFSWNASVRPVSRRHRRKLRAHHSQLSPIVEHLGQEGHSSSGAEESSG